MDQIVSVIVGGVIGLAGGIAGPPLSNWLTEESNKKRKSAEKIEEMIGYIYDHSHWLEEKRSNLLFDGEEVRGPSPIGKAQAITAVYFPKFSDDISALDSASRQYEMWMIRSAIEKSKGNTEKINDGFDEVYKKYYKIRSEFLDNISSFAKANIAAGVGLKRGNKPEA